MARKADLEDLIRESSAVNLLPDTGLYEHMHFLRR